MVEIILDKRQSTHNEFFFNACSNINEDSLRDIINYINLNSNISIEWINDKEIVDNGDTAKGIRVLRKGQHE